MSIWKKIESIDRRWVYLLVAIAVVIPKIFPPDIEISVTENSQKLFDAVEAVPDSSVVMLVLDYYPSTVAECEPMSIAALHHFFRKNCRIITLTNIPQGVTLAETVTRRIAKEYDREYGVDFVNLGYKANYIAVLSGMGTSIVSIFPSDNSGMPLSKIPLMDSVKNYDDITFIFEVADNATADYWVSIVNARYGVPMVCGATAVMAPKFYAFVDAGQYLGLLGGMKGAAEYEKLLEYETILGITGNATKGMGAQSLVHLLIVFLILIGNVGYFVQRREEGKIRQ